MKLTIGVKIHCSMSIIKKVANLWKIRRNMKKESTKKKMDRSIFLPISIVVIFCILGTVVFLVSSKISAKMSA